MDDQSSAEVARNPGSLVDDDSLQGSPSRALRRTTIALLTDHPDPAGNGYSTVLRDTLEAACRLLNLNLFIINGYALDDPSPNGRLSNRVYDWVSPESIDGVVLQSSSLAAFGGVEALHRLSRKYKDIPMCSIGVVVEGVPSVIIDNPHAMRRIVEHVIRDHGCKRPLFLAGPPMNQESQERLAAFREVVQEFRLEADSERIRCGSFTRRGAVDAVNGAIARNVKFDAVIAANDAMALGAIAALRKHGRRVPHDVPVTGFDDVHEVELLNPPMTTSRQPLRAMAELALRLVFEQLEGQSVGLIHKLPTELVIRRSCGCGARSLSTATVKLGGSEPTVTSYIDRNLSSLAHLVEYTLSDGGNPSMSERVRRLVVALRSELSGEVHAFLDAIESMISTFGSNNRLYQQLQEAISLLRVELGPYTTAELENLWHEAREAIMLSSSRSHLTQRMEIVELFARAVRAADQLSTAIRDSPSCGGAEQVFPDPIFKNIFVSRLSASGTDELEALLFVLDGRCRRTPVSTFPANHLMPGQTYPDNRRHSSMVFPLVQESSVLGLVVFEFSPMTNGYEIVCDQLATAMNNLKLHEEVLETTTLHERSVQERLATARRMQSLSVLAGGVAHDLNNALGPIVALPDVILVNLEAALSGDLQATAELRADVEAIKIASLRASRTIKDLLTLGRQGQTEKGQVDLNLVVLDSLPSNSSRISDEGDRRVTLSIDSHHEPLWVNGSEAHLVRAVSNLIRNAIEAIPGRGSVSVRTYPTVIESTIAGFEAIEPGDYAVVSIADTGTGISDSDMGQVFEPFYSKKKLGDESGTGLGLAIVHGVVKEHGGFVDVQSHVGEGTTFSLLFPRTEGKAIESRHWTSPLPLRHARILVVDDELVQLRTSRRILSSLGYAVDTCGSGAEALAQIDAAISASSQLTVNDVSSPYDLVIMDMILHEDLDGLEILDEIRQLVPGQRAIIASGHAPNERIDRALAAGLIWLAKPYTKNELERTVRRALARRASATPEPPASAHPFAINGTETR